MLALAERGYEWIKALKREVKRNTPDLLALSANNDPYYAGSPATRQKAEWFKALWDEYHFTEGVHLRRIHYRLVSVEEPIRKPDGTPYENTEGCWAFLAMAGKYARYLGLVDAHAFEDHRNPAPHLYMAKQWFRESRGVTLSHFSPWTLPAIESHLSTLLHLTLPEVIEVNGYDYAPEDQPYVVEVWVEKSTMDDVLTPLCQRLHVNLVTSVGFQSITGTIKMLRRIRSFDKPTRILYISDFDPAGDDMPVGVARQIEYWLQQYAPNAAIKLTPLALTRAQVMDYRLPRIPIKEEDRRKSGFETRHGEGAVELDALEALYPGALAEVVREAILSYRDLTLERRISDVAHNAREEADQACHDETADLRHEVATLEAQIQAVLSRYEGRLEALTRNYKRISSRSGRPSKPYGVAIENRTEGFDPALPDRPIQETADADEADWLFDSQRDYLTQLRHYKARKAVSTDDAAD
jgi:hypothetical protein